MATKSQLKAYGRVDLDGTHRAVIETDSPEFKLLVKTTHASPHLFKLTKAGKACACLLSEVKRGSGNTVWLDQFKQRHLQIRDGDLVDVEEILPLIAQKVVLRPPPEFSERDVTRLIGKPVTKGEKTAFYTFGGEPRPVTIEEVNPDGIVVIASTTEIVTSGVSDEEVPVTYKDIGGLDREIRLVREVVEYPFRFPDIFKRLGVSQPRGIVLHGPPGTGKTMIARALANEVGAKFYSISGPEIFSMWYGESEKKLRALFNEAQKNAPAVIVIDELDAVAPRREQAHGELEQRIVTSLLTAIDGLKQLKDVVVVGTTNRINAIDTALRGRFAREIHVGVPDSTGRKEILEIHTRRMPLASDVTLDIIVQKTVGFVGRDIATLCREAAYNALRRSFPAEAFEKGKAITPEKLEVNQPDFEGALATIPPSAMREFLIEIPKVSWDDIGGLDEVKRLLVENIAYAITKRQVFEIAGVKPARGILLYGPPGTGKTLLAKAVASQCGANFITVKGPEIRSKWVGESEERIRFLFAKAREVSPCVIFFDEIDAIAPVRGRDFSGITDTIVNQILSEMDGIESADGVFVMAATNRVELLDSALLRPGRFDYQVEVPLPEPAARETILNIHLRGKPLAADVNIKELVELTKGFSGAEIAEVCREAAWEAIRNANFEAEQIQVTMADIKKTLVSVRQTKEKLTPKLLGFRTPGSGEQQVLPT